jgi:hypothetical protein
VIPVGIAAICVGFVLKSAGTQAGPADTALPGPSISVFGTIHPDIFRLRTPLGSGHLSERVRVASLEPQIRFDAPPDAMGMLTDRSASACPSPSSVASLEERFAALADGRVAFAQRFAALTDGPVAFETRFASTHDCPQSFDANLQSAMETLASSLRPAPDQTVASANAVAKPVIPRARPRPAPVRRELPAIDDDGRTAIYDITARTVYLPSGRRLEAHSGFGAMMDNPRHVHVRMKGATPPNVYTLTLRERLFHGVRAIRLNPINDSRMYGRAGILAHTYMLGANGQSNGCVSFNDYDEFLNAYLRGEITRLAVVERLDSPPGRLYAGQLPGAVKDLLKSTDRSRQYAAAGDH